MSRKLNEKAEAKARQRMANTTLSDDDVRAIRAGRDRGDATVLELADFYDISPDSVRKIAARQRFRWVKDLVVRDEDIVASQARLMELLRQDEGPVTLPVLVEPDASDEVKARARALGLGGA